MDATGRVDCPIVGVAADDWTVDQLREHARGHRGLRRYDRRRGLDRFVARLSYLPGDFADDDAWHGPWVAA